MSKQLQPRKHPYNAKKISIQQNCVCEISFISSISYADSYNEINLDVIFESPDGNSSKIPAFWRGNNKWAVRFTSNQIGNHHFKSICSNTKDSGLHGLTGNITVKPYTGKNKLLQHGRLRIAENKSHFVHADGTPFFWFGDTWWMVLTNRLNLKDFKKLTADRVKKGFNLIQLVAGLYPEMDLWDPRGKNEAGFPFAKDFAYINPKFYDYADLKIHHLVSSGLVPCVFGSWGYYLPKIGIEKIKKYWRYLVARYGAYPVIWCVAGEATMPYYLSKNRKEDEELQKQGWREIASYVKNIDAYNNLLSIHPPLFDPKTSDSSHGIKAPGNARDISEQFDFEMLQTGHSGWDSISTTISEVTNAITRKPKIPVVNSEVNYEGIFGSSWQDIQRLSFYLSIFNGAVGYTYGANGLWQFNQKNKLYGASPTGFGWGNTLWEEAANFQGGKQVAKGAQFIMQLPWWKFEKHNEWVESRMNETGWRSILCIGIPQKLRLIYVPQFWMPPLIKSIEHNKYKAYYFDPCTGIKHNVGIVKPDNNSNWEPPFPPEIHDWIIVLEAT